MGLTDEEILNILMNSDNEEENFDNEWLDNEHSSDSENEHVPDAMEDSVKLTETGSDIDNKPKRPKISDDSTKFIWKNTNFIPALFEFDVSESGCRIENLAEEPTVLEIFEHFVSEEFIEQIVSESIKYKDYLVSQNNADNMKNYKCPNKNEMYLYLAICLLMPQVKKQRVKDYWSKDFVIETPVFAQLMSRGRFIELTKYLHFADNANVNKNDKLFKIRFVVDHFRKTFRDSLYPFQNLVIDESLVLFKGRISFRQYIPSKRHRFGIKFFIIVDCETGYILDFLIYTGGTTEINEFDTKLGKSGNIVMTLTAPYFGKGHRLYTDNWYSSPLLFEELFKRKLNCCGTVKTNRLFMPKFEKCIPKGTTQSFSTDNLLAIKWADKRDVHILTSMHYNTMVTVKTKHNEDKNKPGAVVDYNKNMGGVDQSDMLLSSTESVRKTVKWYKKIFFHLLDLSVLNSHIVYKIKTGKNINLLDFQRELVKALIAKYKTVQPRSSTRRAEHGHSPLRLIERHFPKMYARNPESNRITLKRCVVCSKHMKRKETSYYCPSCQVPLCILDCFEKYHTLVKF